MATADQRFGRIDILINNVGGTIWAKPLEHYVENQIEAEIRRSLFPTLWCCHSVLPYMLKQGSGAIVTEAQSEQEQVWYQKIVDQKIDSTLMKRYGTIDEQASAILFLASDEASYITGVTLPVGGGDLG